jgi:hypothetical protein
MLVVVIQLFQVLHQQAAEEAALELGVLAVQVEDQVEEVYQYPVNQAEQEILPL